MAEEEISEKMQDLEVADGDGSMPLEKKKKKKKKTTTADIEGMLAEATEADDGEAPVDLGLAKKKKKKKKARDEEDFGEDTALADDGEAAAAQTGSGLPWDGSDRDYTYDELLDRVFGILREHNPALTGERRRTLMKPPQVAREGTKKTVFTNFMELNKSMNRQPEHVQQFLLAELGTSGSLDGQNRLIVKGRFQPKAFEGVLRRYMNEYVLCNSCKSPDTLLDRDSGTRINFLRCQQCGASRTVAPIKAGFVARTTRRPKV